MPHNHWQGSKTTLDAAGQTGMITVSRLAADYIGKTLDVPDNAGKFIRIRVNKGGCAGYEYDLALDNRLTDEDLIHEHGQHRIVFDRVTGTLIEGSQLDFNEDLIGRGFLLRNPNAEVTCGCGTSFNIKPRRSPMKHMRAKREDRPRSE